MQVYRVGALFSDERQSWPQGSHLWMDETVRFAVFLHHPHPREVDAIYRGAAKFAWIDEPLTGYLAYRFGEMPWSDAPFNPQRQAAAAPFAIPEQPRGTHLLVHIFLVGAGDGVIQAMRLVTWPAHFVNTVRRSVARLAAQPYSDVRARAAEDQHWAQFNDGPAVARLVRERAAATCTGGTELPAME